MEEYNGKRRRKQERFQYCTDPSGQEILHFQLFKVIHDAISLILHYRTMFLFRTISTSTLIMSDVQSICIPSSIQDWYREDNSGRDRQTVFFTAVNPMHQNHKDPQEFNFDQATSCIAREKMEKAVRYGVLGRYTACSTERIEVLSNKIERNHKSAEIIYQRVYVSPRPPPKISFKDNWMCDLDSDVAGSSNDTQRIEPKPQTQLSSLGRPVCGQESAMEIEKRTKSDHDTFGLRET